MTFEQKLFGNDKDRAKKFRELAVQTFGDGTGKQLLAMLCGAANPLEHRDGMTPHEHGQREVVATLWRWGSSSTSVDTD